MPKVYKQGRDDIEMKVVYKASSIPTPVCSVEQKRCRNGPSLLCHPFLPCLCAFWHAIPTSLCIFEIFLSTFLGYNLFQCTITLHNSLVNWLQLMKPFSRLLFCDSQVCYMHIPVIKFGNILYSVCESPSRIYSSYLHIARNWPQLSFSGECQQSMVWDETMYVHAYPTTC